MQKYVLDGKYCGYLYQYYALYGFVVLTGIFKEKLSAARDGEMVSLLYSDIFVSFISEEVSSFLDFNAAFLKQIDEVIQIRFGDHSGEYSTIKQTFESLSVVLAQVEKLSLSLRIALKVSFIYAISGQLEELYCRVGCGEEKPEKAILSDFRGVKCMAVSALFRRICDHK